MPLPSKNPIKENIMIVQQDQAAQIEGAREGKPALFTCPDCGGVLWQVREPELVQFRCHVGHVVAGEHLFEGQLMAAENALWTSIRTLEDRMVLGQQLAAAARRRQDERAAAQFEAHALRAERKYQMLRQIAESGEGLSPVAGGGGEGVL